MIRKINSILSIQSMKIHAASSTLGVIYIIMEEDLVFLRRSVYCHNKPIKIITEYSALLTSTHVSTL
jgi:hypothetical protein